MVIDVNKYFIYEYISRIKKDDVINYSKRLGITLSTNDLEIIFYYLKNEYERFFNNPLEVLNEIKSQVEPNTYIFLMELYSKYKDKIK